MDFSLQLQILLTTIIASVLGGVLGFEREMSQKPAGMRTNMLVAASSALLVSLGAILVNSYEMSPVLDHITTDPIRIIEAIVVGVSFIGGGIIIQNKDKGSVQNLTTAATVLFAATIGICVALEQYVLAVGITIFNLLVNFGIYQFEKWLPQSTKK